MLPRIDNSVACPARAVVVAFVDMRSAKAILFLATSLTATLFISALTRASSVLALDLSTLTARAERIVVGQVVSVKSEWDASHRNIHTRIELKVEECWKGVVPADGRLVIVQPGGSVDDIEMHVHGMPGFVPNERAVLFLAGQAAPAVVGMSQGKRSLRWESAGKRWMADGPDLSAVVRRDERGLLQPVAPETSTPLDDLRRRVRALITP